MLRNEFPGEILLQGAPVPVLVSVGLDINEDGVAAETLAEVDIRLNLSDGSIFHFGGLFTRKLLTRAAAILDSVANRESDSEEIYDYDFYFNLRFAPISGDESHVMIHGGFYLPWDDTKLASQWQEIITQHDIAAYPEESLRGLVLTRSNVAKIAALFREFMDLVGEALPDESPYDN